MASSMPELAHQSSSVMSPYRQRTKGNLSVRFENEPDEDEEEERETTSSKRYGRSSKHRRRRRYSHRRTRDDDSDSYCSTCSSSSSSDDPTVYQLPARRQYGAGARISYVPNDTLAFAKRQQQTLNGKVPLNKRATPVDDKNCVIS